LRFCANCRIEDSLIYDIGQPCHCMEDGYPIGETQHDASRHDPSCARLRHRVAPYIRKLRSFRAVDGVPDENGRFVLPDEFAYLKKNGFGARKHSGYLWAEKLLCRACIIQWEQRQLLKRDYDARCAALSRDEKPHEYEQMICF
jgi:hypothetical protein